MSTPATSTDAPVLLLLGASAREYRGYTLEQIATEHRIVLLDSAPPAWARPYLSAQITVDLTDHTAARRAAKEAAAALPVTGVLTYLEHHVELAARIARDLGLPAPAPEAVAACRDETRTRQLLAAHRVPSARSITVATPDEAVAAADTIGYPVVIKPRSMAGSAGVRRADTPADIRAFYHAAATESVLGLDEHVDAADTLRRDPAIHAVAHAALEAVGITTGVMHVEMRLTSEGPRIVEINARLGGVTGVLVEEYLDGPEISVECVVLGRGQAEVVAVTRKHLGPEPAFQETGHTGPDPQARRTRHRRQPPARRGPSRHQPAPRPHRDAPAGRRDRVPVPRRPRAHRPTRPHRTRRPLAGAARRDLPDRRPRSGPAARFPRRPARIRPGHRTRRRNMPRTHPLGPASPHRPRRPTRPRHRLRALTDPTGATQVTCADDLSVRPAPSGPARPARRRSRW